MDYKIKLGHINVNIPGEASIELKDIEFEVNNFKLKDVTSIVKEVKNIVTEMRELEKMNHEAQKQQQEREYEHFMSAIAVQEQSSLSNWLDTMAQQPNFDDSEPEMESGLDTDGDKPQPEEETSFVATPATPKKRPPVKPAKNRDKGVVGVSFHDKPEPAFAD